MLSPPLVLAHQQLSAGHGRSELPSGRSINNNVGRRAPDARLTVPDVRRPKVIREASRMAAGGSAPSERDLAKSGTAGARRSTISRSVRTSGVRPRAARRGFRLALMAGPVTLGGARVIRGTTGATRFSILEAPDLSKDNELLAGYGLQDVGFPLIGETGFEPATARPPAGCATRLRHSPAASGRRESNPP